MTKRTNVTCKIMLAAIAALCVAAAPLSSWADETIGENTTLDADRTIDGVLTIAAGVTVDLAGHKLTAQFAGTPAGAATITSSVAGGELHARVDGEFNNNNIALTGSLKLVKEGAGVWIATKTGQSYTGGTLVYDGTLRILERGSMPNNMIPRTPAIEVGPDGILDVNGTYGWGYHSTTLNGGCIYEGRGGYTGNQSMNGKSLALTADSRIHIAAFTVEWNVLSLNDNTLSVQIEQDGTWSRGNTLNGPGAIDVSGAGIFHTRGTMNAPTVDLRVASAMNMANEFSVKDYYANYSGTVNSGTAALKVNGVFTPVTDSFYGCTMMNGSTIDLSAKSGIWSTTSSFTTGNGTVSFASGAVVTVDVHGRTLDVGEQIVSWTQAPANATFRWDAATEANGVELFMNDSGIFYGSPSGSITSAVWTGMVDADVSKPSNWICRNGEGEVVPDGLPGMFTAVEFLGAVRINIPAGTTFRYSSLTVNCSLSADSDWSGLSRMTGSIDLKGKKLTLATLAGSGTVTDSAGNGELHVNVPDGITVDNQGVALTGNLALVKEGEGTLVATKTQQSYSGHTRVTTGTLKINNANATSYIVPRNSLIVLEENGTLDINGCAGWGYHSVSNNGGRIYNAYANHTGVRSMNLAHHYIGADSTLHAEADTVAWSVLDLNDHTLNVEIAANKTLHVGNKVNGPGRIDIKYGGWLHPRQAMDMSTVDLRVGGALNLEFPITVHDYEAVYEFGSNSGTAALNVTGTFRPLSTKRSFYGCTLMDGSTVDLSGVDGAFNMKSAFTAGKNVVGFAEGATVSLDVGERTITSKEPILVWPEDAEPENIDSVKFKLIGGRKGGYFEKKDCGLYYAMCGLSILVR